jgi:hypothetical protein
MAQSARRLTARPVESEQPGAEINHFQEQQSFTETAQKNLEVKEMENGVLMVWLERKDHTLFG